MAWPNRAANLTEDVWPTADDLAEWIKDLGGAATGDVVADAFRSADQAIRARLDPELFTAAAGAAGIETDEDAVGYDEDVLHAWCPAYVRQAILIRGAAIYSRRNSANGTISFGEFAARVARMDPDVDDLIAPVRIPGIG